MKKLIQFQLTTVLLFIMCSFSYGKNMNTLSLASTDSLTFKIFYVQAVPGDILTIAVSDNMLQSVTETNNGDRRRKYQAGRNAAGSFDFCIPIHTGSGYFELWKNRVNGEVANIQTVRMIQPQLWEDGDSLTITLDFKETILGGGGKAVFSGKGSLKYNLAEAIANFQLPNWGDVKISEMWPATWDGNIFSYQSFDSIATINQGRLGLLEQAKNRLSIQSYNIMKANIIYASKSGILGKIRGFARRGGLQTLTTEQRNTYLIAFQNSFDFPNNYGIDPRYLVNSKNYLDFLLQKIQTTSELVIGKYSAEYVFDSIEKYKISQEIKEVVYLKELIQGRVYAYNQKKYFDKAGSLVTRPEYVAILNELRRRTSGGKFINFSLTDQSGKIRTLEQFKSKIVVLDFWYTGCGHCAILYENVLSKIEEEYKTNPSIVFISVSIDKEEKLWKKSLSEGIYTSTAATNLYTGGLKDRHPIIVDNNISGYPCVVLLDQDGKIMDFNSQNLYSIETFRSSIKGLLK